jgi:hypothetical protein
MKTWAEMGRTDRISHPATCLLSVLLSIFGHVWIPVLEQVWRGFYLYAIRKDGSDLCATKKFVRTCVPLS